MLEKKPYETSEEAEQRIKTHSVEDQIINEFIQNDVNNIFDSKKVMLSNYNNASDKDQQILDQAAFGIISTEYEKKIEQFPRYSGIKFENFVKLFNNSREWSSELRDLNAKEGTPSHLWSHWFGEDMGLFRQAALNGYQRVLENTEDTPQI
tara:strand:- start:756 stop:1208 length:453 start_codon:yes stop_codon:yes gene_type:complete